MNMKLTSATVSFGVACLVLSMTGCSGNGSSSSSSEALPEVDVEVPTQAEADARAAQEISNANADNAFADLQAEIERDGGD